MIGTWSLMIFFGMHLLIGLCQAGYSFGDAATCDGAESYLCGTPLIGLVDVMRETPSFSPISVVRIVGSIISNLWGMFSFDYAILSGGSGIHSIIGYVIRVAGALAGTIMMLTLASSLLQSIRR